MKTQEIRFRFLLSLALLVGLSLSAQETIPPRLDDTPTRIRIPAELPSSGKNTKDDSSEDSDAAEQAALSMAAQARGWVPPGTSGIIRTGMPVQVTVTVQGQTMHQTKAQRVTESGRIGLPLLNNVEVGGRSIEVIETLLTKAYSEYYRNPLVNVQYVGSIEDPSASPWGFVTLLGEVNITGPVAVPPTGRLTVSGAIQRAGGVTVTANKGSIRIYRPFPGEQRVERIKVDLEDVGKGKAEEDAVLRPGDVVWVPERIF